MKKTTSLLFIFLLLFFVVSCTKTPNKVMYLEGEVEEITESGIIVNVTDSGSSNVSVGSNAFFDIKGSHNFSVADKVSLTFSGNIMETDPLRFEGPYQLEIIKKAPHTEEQSLPKLELENPLDKCIVSEIGRGKLMPDDEMSRNDAERLFAILNTDTWCEGATDCLKDCKIIIDGVLYYYHSSCGTFFKPNLAEYSTKSAFEPKDIGASLELSEELKNKVNEILKKYITLKDDVAKESNLTDGTLPQVYVEKLNEYVEASLMCENAFWNQGPSINTLIMNFYRHANDMTISYALYDIDRNDTEELFILSNESIIDLYTIKDKKLVRLLPGDYGERIRLFAFTDGKLMVEGSHSAFMSSFEIYSIENGSKIKKGKAFYHNDECDNGEIAETHEKLSLNEYLKVIEQYKEKSVTNDLLPIDFLSKNLPDPDFHPQKFKVCIRTYEDVYFPNEDDAMAIIEILESQSYSEPICKCVPNFYVDYDGKEYGVKLSKDDAYIRLGDNQATLSPRT